MLSTSFNTCASSGYSSLKCSTTSLLTCSLRSSRSAFTNVSSEYSTLSIANSRTCCTNSSEGLRISNSNLGLPTCATMDSMNSTIFLISTWASIIALSISASETSFAPASTIIIASFVPDTVRCRRLFSRCSLVGFIMNSPSTRPTLTEPVGPIKGASLIDSAIDEPIIATMSGSTSCSTESTVAIT